MAEPFVGQIIAVGFNFAPQGWHLCDGSLMSIAENAALFQLIGTTYGGDGQATFALPDLRGRGVVATGQGPGLQSYILGQSGGAEQVTLSAGQFAAHTHGLMAAGAATAAAPASSAVLATPASGTSLYAQAGTSTTLAASAVAPAAGGGQPHENRQPSTTVTYIISLFGVFPSQG